MKIICDKLKLLDGLNIVMKAILGKTTMEILECLVIEAKENKIKLIANDLKIGIETFIDGEIVEEGTVAVKAKVFSEIVRKLPSDEISIEIDEKYQMEILCGKAKFTISARQASEFPFLPDIVKDKCINMSQQDLKDIIQQTVFSISNNENNKIMTGEHFEIKDGFLKVVSLDGFRVSLRKLELKDVNEEVSVIIPGKTLLEISKIINGGKEDNVAIYFTDKHVLFEFDQTLVLSRLIEGNYYLVDKMINVNFETKITTNKKELLECIDRTTLLLKESDKKPVIIDVKDNHLGFKISSSLGTMDEEIEAVKEGKDLLIGFNPRYLMDALRVISDESIDIYMVNDKSPCVIKNENGDYIYLILPVNFIS